MSIGPAIRRRLGRLEQPAADAYRAAFFNVGHFAEVALTLCPTASRVLEIGCGDGDVASRITAQRPGVEYVGIDLAPEPGRRYQGDRGHAVFRSMLSSELRAEHPEPFDLVLVVDVLHHVPDDEDRVGIITDAAAMLAPGGTLLVKEWERVPGLAYKAGWAADRYVSGDALVRYMDRPELLGIIGKGAPSLEHVQTLTVRPWRCNVVHALRNHA